MDPRELPIFELPLVVLPTELVPLHIFEQRYRRMVGACLEDGEPFGIVLSDDDGPREVGCTVRVEEVVERFEDGRFNVIVRGEHPFRLVDRFEAEEWPAASVELIEPSEDEEEGTDPDVAGDVRDAFRSLVERVRGEPGEEIGDEGSFEIASRVELPAETKQRLLELRSEEERMEVLRRALTALIDALDRSQEIAERASMNGKVSIDPRA